MITVESCRVEQNPNQEGDFLIFGSVYKDGVLLHTFGDEGTSLFSWWTSQPYEFQFYYATMFSTIMANNYGI